jgi:hypothetical protein
MERRVLQILISQVWNRKQRRMRRNYTEIRERDSEKKKRRTWINTRKWKRKKKKKRKK